MAEQKYSTTQLVLAVLLVVAFALAAYILATDNILWEFNPTNAYSLIVFAIIWLFLSGLVFVRWHLALLALPVWSAVHFVLLLADIAYGLNIGYTPGEAVVYLFTKQPGGGYTPYFVVSLVLLIVSALVFLRARKGTA